MYRLWIKIGFETLSYFFTWEGRNHLKRTDLSCQVSWANLSLNFSGINWDLRRVPQDLCDILVYQECKTGILEEHIYWLSKASHAHVISVCCHRVSQPRILNSLLGLAQSLDLECSHCSYSSSYLSFFPSFCFSSSCYCNLLCYTVPNYKRRLSPLTPKAERLPPPPNHTKGPKPDWILRVTYMLNYHGYHLTFLCLSFSIYCNPTNGRHYNCYLE